MISQSVDMVGFSATNFADSALCLPEGDTIGNACTRIAPNLHHGPGRRL